MPHPFRVKHSQQGQVPYCLTNLVASPAVFGGTADFDEICIMSNRSSTPVDPHEAATPVSLAVHTSSSAAAPSLTESPPAALHSLQRLLASAACAGTQTFGSWLGLLLCVCPSWNACPDFSHRCWECCWVTAVPGSFCHKLTLYVCQTVLTAGALSQ